MQFTKFATIFFPSFSINYVTLWGVIKFDYSQMELLSRFSLTLEFDFNFIAIIYECKYCVREKGSMKKLYYSKFILQIKNISLCRALQQFMCLSMKFLHISIFIKRIFYRNFMLCTGANFYFQGFQFLNPEIILSKIPRIPFSL